MEKKELENKMISLYVDYQKFVDQRKELDAIDVMIRKKHDELEKAEEEYIILFTKELKDNFLFKEGERVIVTKEVFSGNDRISFEQRVLLITEVSPVIIHNLQNYPEYKVDYTADLFTIKLSEIYFNYDRFNKPYHPEAEDITFNKNGDVFSPWSTLNSESKVRRKITVEKTDKTTV